MGILTTSQWSEFLLQHPEAHYQQSPCWGEAKSVAGYADPVYIATQSAGAQILFPRLPMGIKIAYIPNGPIGKGWLPLWQEIDHFCRIRGVIFLKVEPDAYEPLQQDILDELQGFQHVVEYIQPRRNIVVDLTGSEEEWLARMRRTGRQNTKHALQRGVKVRESDDLITFWQMVQSTAFRRGFQLRGISYFEKIYHGYRLCAENPLNSFRCVILLAEYENKPLAGLMTISGGSRCWGVYTGCTAEERERRPAHLLHFEAMRWAARHGCTTYDIGSVPDYDEDYLESHCNQTEQSWGLYRFKRGFGGKVVRTVGAYDPCIYPPSVLVI